MDFLTKEDRSDLMAKIRSKNTRPEKVLRSILHRSGYRFGLHNRKLPGKPDIIMPKYNLVIFINGCFWHLHDKCKSGRIPKSNASYWKPKLIRKKRRDIENIKKCKELGC